MSGLLAVLTLVLAAGELELPHLVVRGSAHVDLPQREYWAVPRLPEGIPPGSLRRPELGDSHREAPVGPLHRPPPAGFTLSAAVGPVAAGVVTAGIGEGSGGVAGRLWSFDAGELERRGMRVSVLFGGSWGTVAARLQHWADRLAGFEIAPGWVHGDLSAKVPLGLYSARAQVSGSGSQGEKANAHGQMWLDGPTPLLGLPFELTGGDHIAGGTVSWRHEAPLMAITAGPMMVDDGDTTRVVAQASAGFGPLEVGRTAWTISAERALSFLDEASLREGFPAAHPSTPYRALLVDWRVAGTVAVRVSSRMTFSGTFENRRIGVAPAWREIEPRHWVTESLTGEGLRTILSAAWREPGWWVDGGVALDRLKVASRSGPLPYSRRWPLTPGVRWWASAVYGQRPRMRAMVEGEAGLHGWDESLPASGGVSVEAAMPLGGGWEAIARGAGGWGFSLTGRPRTMVALGVGWSLKRPYGQEGAK